MKIRLFGITDKQVTKSLKLFLLDLVKEVTEKEVVLDSSKITVQNRIKLAFLHNFTVLKIRFDMIEGQKFVENFLLTETEKDNLQKLWNECFYSSKPV